jgi:hypothetical protein
MQKDRGLCEIWKNFNDFIGILEGLGPNCK